MPKGMIGKKHSEETRAKMSQKAKLRKPTFTGKTHTAESKEKMRLAKLKNPTKYWAGKSRDKDFMDSIRVKARRAISNKVYTPEERLKKSENRRGEKCHFWKGGISQVNEIERKRIEYTLWREAVFSRDNWTCRECGKRGGAMNAHHIKPFANHPELRTAIDNGITLCEKCHKKTHYNK